MSYRTYIVEGDEARGSLPPGWDRLASTAGFSAGFAAGWVDWAEAKGNHDCVREFGHVHLTRDEAEQCLRELAQKWEAQGVEVERE